ncbi:site-specific DNA-methyltransferase [Tidjanibacter massiliensis]|uniref:site-specific DNA-methyltransferase n=1 Tax=Tidjanibacter massiliensis TaxID=1871003 RepID=UPI0008F85DBD|nr:site-specific DNA-methyltransferase [Tidjanibacter massiliensis]
MPTLTWIGKEKVVNHHQEVPYRVLEHKYGFRADDPADTTPTNSGNKIIHSDNLEALKSLLPEYEGRIKCIYIDPPYNTGNEKWVYNDNVNDPKIKKWLGEVVGKQGEDLSRHDKWLCMMYPRLKLLHKLLAEDGAIFISIDDNELANLKLLCDEIFGVNNFIGQWHWFKSATPPNLSYKIKKNIEYVLCYEKQKSSTKYKGVQKVSGSDDPMTKPQNSLKILKFPAGSIHVKGADRIIPAGIYGTDKFPNKLLNDLIVTNGVNANEVEFENKFIWLQEKLENELAQNTIINCSNRLVLSYKKQEYDPEVPPNLIDSEVGVNTTEEAGKVLSVIFNGRNIFDYPKDVSLIEYIINFLCSPNDIILDSFAGSGTTAHAVLNLNKKDKGNRKFILVEMEEYAENITAERVRRVMKGYGEGKNAVVGTGGAFDYYELGERMFDEDQNLNERIGEEKIREYIYYTETKRHLDRERTEAAKYLLDTYNATGYYFYYEKERLTTLSIDTLGIVTERAEQYVIYADICTVPPQVLAARNITFKKIPRDIKRF